jgi:hypothetical protein
MAVPTITTITPAGGSPLGQYLLTIDGTNFRLPTPAPATSVGLLRIPPPVQVLVDGEPAKDVRVYSATLLTCLAPAWRGNVPSKGTVLGVAGTSLPDPLPRAVDVKVTNVTDEGVQIGAETVTAVAAFTYARERITREADSWVTRVVRETIRIFRRQVLFNTRYTPSTERFDAASGDLRLMDLGELPALAITGPIMPKNWFHARKEHRTSTNLDGSINVYREGIYVDLTFGLRGYTDKHSELLNLAQLCMRMFHKEGYLYVDNDPADPSKGRQRHDFAWVKGTEPAIPDEPNLSNFWEFTSSFQVMGVAVEDIDIIRVVYPLDEPDGVELELGLTIP